MVSRARPRQSLVGSRSSRNSTSLTRKPAMSPSSRDSISTGNTAPCGPGTGGSSGCAAPVSPAPAMIRVFQAEAAAAGVDFVGPMAPQGPVSQTTQQAPWTVWLSAISVLPQNGHGSSALIIHTCAVYPGALAGAALPSRTSLTGTTSIFCGQYHGGGSRPVIDVWLGERVSQGQSIPQRSQYLKALLWFPFIRNRVR